MKSMDVPGWLLPLLIVIAVGSAYMGEFNSTTSEYLAKHGYLQNLAASLTGFAVGGIAAVLIFDRARAKARRNRWQLVERLVTYSIYSHVAAVGEVVAQAYIASRDEWLVGVPPPRELTQMLPLGMKGPAAADMAVWSSARARLADRMTEALLLRDEVVPALRAGLRQPGKTLSLPEDYAAHELLEALSRALDHTSERAHEPVAQIEPHLAQLREVLLPRIADLTDDDKLVRLFEQFNFFSYLWNIALRESAGVRRTASSPEALALAAARTQIRNWMDEVVASPAYFRPNERQVEAITLLAITYGFQVGSAGLLFNSAGNLYFYLLKQLAQVGQQHLEQWTMLDIAEVGHRLLPDHSPK